MKTDPSELPLTLKQRSVVEFVQWYIAQHRRPPLIREVQEACGIASYKSAVDRLNALERKGLIKRRPHKHRGIRLSRRLLHQGAVPAWVPAAEPSRQDTALQRAGGDVDGH